MLKYLGGKKFPIRPRKFVAATGTILTEPLHYDCPFCSASIEVTSAHAAGNVEKAKCSGCQRKVEIPERVLSKLPEPDDDDDFLSGVPLRATGDEDVLTAADLAIGSGSRKEAADPLENDFEFSVVDGESSTEVQSEADDHQEEDLLESNNGGSEVSASGTNIQLDDSLDKSKSIGDEDLNQLLAGGDKGASRSVEKGTFAIRCSVCDSRLLVSLVQVGKQVKCSDCFSMIKVRPPTEKEKAQIEKQVRLSLEGESDLDDGTSADDGELTLAPIIEDELDEAEVVAEIVEDENDQPLTLREGPPADLDELSETDTVKDDFADVVFTEDEEFPDDDEGDLGEDLLSEDLSLSGPLELEDSQTDPTRLAAAYTAKRSKDIGSQTPNPYRSKSAQNAKKRSKEGVFKPKPKSSSQSESKFPKLRFDEFFGAAVELVTERSVAVRGFVVAALMAIGNIISHSALSTFEEIDAPTLGDTATMGIWRFGVGWLPYAIGTILLWYFCGVIFREAAGGKRKIKSWKLGPTTEWSSTLLMTAVSFAVAGSPVLMFMSIYITAPVRFLLALPFLTAVWHAQSPFAIISSDVVVHLRKNGKHWKTVFSVVLALASIAFVAGVLMHVPMAWVNVLTSALGAVFLSFVTMAFAAVAGWHSGMVVEELN